MDKASVSWQNRLKKAPFRDEDWPVEAFDFFHDLDDKQRGGKVVVYYLLAWGNALKHHTVVVEKPSSVYRTFPM